VLPAARACATAVLPAAPHAQEVEEIVLKKMSSNISKKMLQHFAKY
jgi:hypothetical protein